MVSTSHVLLEDPARTLVASEIEIVHSMFTTNTTTVTGVMTVIYYIFARLL